MFFGNFLEMLEIEKYWFPGQNRVDGAWKWEQYFSTSSISLLQCCSALNATFSCMQASLHQHGSSAETKISRWITVAGSLHQCINSRNIGNMQEILKMNGKLCGHSQSSVNIRNAKNTLKQVQTFRNDNNVYRIC